MKKTILSLVLLTCVSGTAFAQFSDSIKPYPHRELQVAMSLTDFIAHRVRLESSYRFHRQHAAGIGIGDLYGHIDIDNHMWDTDDNELSGFFLSGHHKYYLYGSYMRRYMFMRSSINFQRSRIAYEGQQWVTFLEDGVEVLSLLPVKSSYNISSLGVNFEIGFEAFYEVWFMELSMGASHRSVLSAENRPLGRDSGQRFGDLDYEGLAPVVNFRVGAYLF